MGVINSMLQCSKWQIIMYSTPYYTWRQHENGVIRDVSERERDRQRERERERESNRPATPFISKNRIDHSSKLTSAMQTCHRHG